MESIELAKRYLNKLDIELAKFPISDTNPLVMIESSFYLVDKTIQELKEGIKELEFLDEEEEIEFFKVYMTEFLSRSHFFSELFQIESERLGIVNQSDDFFYSGKMEEVKKYFQRYAALNNYLIMGKSYLDRVYFLRGSEAPLIYPDLFRHTIDSSFCTVYTLHFARLKAMEKLMNYLSKKVRDVQGEVEKPSVPNQQTSILWTGSKVELVELIYALKTTTVVNHGSITVAELAKAFGFFLAKS
ncbi:RteC domain-containing protein [Algoriphagus sp. AGSA1]|uniref:RteC domain-containing protein n=1 Tax=Algoriphagus sp. AGSA1 TaxID=2907213 RepID=UPI001F2103B4|nr:RteC domain-containing protein [Algoriphagus sp. AGSA1]MCE7054726.1 RteC domain-containing protein [Algoriphagus sp. AGSA1]